MTTTDQLLEAAKLAIDTYFNGIFLLGIVFVTLKLCGVIDWSWWWVTAPFWGGFAILLALIIACGLFILAAMFFAWISNREY
jgi:hypothetical protein